MPRNVNPDQLAMFMTPDQIKGYVDGSVDDETVGKDEVWQGKRRHSLLASIAERGVEKPVIIAHAPGSGEKFMGNGHHRVQNAHDVQNARGRSQFVPVLHNSGPPTSSDVYMGYGLHRHFGVATDRE